MNASLRETGCLKKSLDGIFFSPCLRIMHINIVFKVQGSCLFVTYTIIQGIISSEIHNRSAALFTAATKETMFN